MTAQIDYYLSLNSPWAYLGAERLERIAARHGATVRALPVNYGEIFSETGGLPLPQRAPARQAYRLVELQRWSQALDIPVTLHPKHFPFPEPLAAQMIYAAEAQGGQPLKLTHAILKALWAEERDPGDDAVLVTLAEATGHDGQALLDAARRPEMEERYAAATRQALAAGVFGAPSYLVEGEIFWGQDRLDFLDRKLGKL